jgi:adenylate kinase
LLTKVSRYRISGYSQKKITENIECEIFEVVLEEARESYAEEIVIELTNDTVDDLDNNVDRVKQWYEAWTAQRTR